MQCKLINIQIFSQKSASVSVVCKIAQLGFLMGPAVDTGYRYYQVALRCRDTETHHWPFVEGVCFCCSLKKMSFRWCGIPKRSTHTQRITLVLIQICYRKCISILPNCIDYRHVYSNYIYIYYSVTCIIAIYASGYLIILMLLHINLQPVITHTHTGKVIFSDKYCITHSCLLWAWEINVTHLTEYYIGYIIRLWYLSSCWFYHRAKLC